MEELIELAIEVVFAIFTELPPKVSLTILGLCACGVGIYFMVK